MSILMNIIVKNCKYSEFLGCAYGTTKHYSTIATKHYSTSVEIFKTQVKTYLFKIAFNW